MSDEELRMEAYYYSFDKTGQVEIDRILSAIACAGKAFHHTNDWNDEATPRTFHEGATPIDWIQNRAKEAADTIEALRAENAKLLGLLDNALGWLDDKEHDEPLLSVDSIRAARGETK